MGIFSVPSIEPFYGAISWTLFISILRQGITKLFNCPGWMILLLRPPECWRLQARTWCKSYLQALPESQDQCPSLNFLNIKTWFISLFVFLCLYSLMQWENGISSWYWEYSYVMFDAFLNAFYPSCLQKKMIPVFAILSSTTYFTTKWKATL